MTTRTTTTRRLGRNRGHARLWLEGAFLACAGWTRGTRYSVTYAAGSIVLAQDPDGSRTVAGTDSRPIIDTNNADIERSLPDTITARVIAEAGRILVRGAIVATACTMGFFPAHARSVLIGCEYSGLVRDAFEAQGHDVISCDLLDTERPEGSHHIGDLLDLLHRRQWDTLIAFPPCTYLSSSGAWRCNPKHDPDGIRLAKQREAVAFVRALWDAGTEQCALENPIGVLSTQWQKPAQIIQPWQFGHGETKATCLWLRGLPLLTPTNIVDGRAQRIWSMGPSPERWKERSRTFAGIAAAMGAQWGTLHVAAQLSFSLV